MNKIIHAAFLIILFLNVSCSAKILNKPLSDELKESRSDSQGMQSSGIDNSKNLSNIDLLKEEDVLDNMIYEEFTNEDGLKGVKLHNEILVPAQYDYLSLTNNNKYAIVGMLELDENGEKLGFPEAQYGCISISESPGEILIPIKYWRLHPGSKMIGAELRSNLNNIRAGIIDYNDNIIVPFEYENIRAEVNGLYCVMKNNKYGYIDENGKELLSPQFDNCELFSDKNDYTVAYICYKELSREKDYGHGASIEFNLCQYAVIHKNGEMIYECPYVIRNFDQSLIDAIQVEGNKYATLDTTSLNSDSAYSLSIDGYYGTWGVSNGELLQSGYDYFYWGEYHGMLDNVIDWDTNYTFSYIQG